MFGLTTPWILAGLAAVGFLFAAQAKADVALPAASSAESATQQGASELPPFFKGEAMPTPPAQSKPWMPPETKLPKVVVTAATELFNQGLADPRECEYREVEVAVGNCWDGGGQAVKVHAWVLPTAKDQTQRFAVCWNGLVYPAVTVGPAADLKADVLATVKADEVGRAARAKDNPSFPFTRMIDQAEPEGTMVSQQTLQPLGVCLLLRFGQTDLAEAVWKTWADGVSNANNYDVFLHDPYLVLAEDWTWAMFDRAVCAHMRGDDHLALLTVRTLATARKAVVESAKNEKFLDRPKDGVWEEVVGHCFGFLTETDGLLADQERRAKEPAQSADELAKATAATKDKAARIRLKIQQLENVGSRQWGQPGGVALGSDPNVQALIQEGEGAVEPLLDCLEKDTRLTRSVHIWRDFARDRSLIGVHEAAYVALAGILKTGFFGPGSTGDDLSARGLEGRKKVAAGIRAYWKKFKGVPVEERWFQILADDQRLPNEWLQAATNIAQAENVAVTPGTMIGTGFATESPVKPGEKPKLRGESLRSRKNPSVSELVARRVDKLIELAMPAGDEKKFLRYEQANLMRGARDLALRLRDWDREAGQPVVRKIFHVLLKAQTMDSIVMTQSAFAVMIAELTEVLAADGDQEALGEYSKWIVRQTPKGLDFDVVYTLRPLFYHASDPAVSAAAEAMFHGEGSPWNPLVGAVERPENNIFHDNHLFDTGLLSLPAFQKQILRQLADKAVIGKFRVHADESGFCIDVSVHGAGVTGAGGSAAQAYRGDPLCPADGTEGTIRVCDFYAWRVSELPGCPHCEVFWPEAERDRAVAAGAEFVRRYGHCYRPGGDSNAFYDTVRFFLPPLDHPATKDDVAHGRAIFSLEGQGEVRLVKTIALPLKAKCKNYYKGGTYGFDHLNEKTGQKEYVISYFQDGQVWQAEEILKDGRWQRYYGFVGRYCLAQVPAAELELLNEDGSPFDK